MAIFADIVLSKQFTAVPRQCAAAMLHTSRVASDSSKDMETEATDKPKAVFDKRARSKSAAAQRAKQLVEAAAASASAASSSSPSSIESQPSDQSASSDPSGTDSTEAGGASAPPRTPSLLDQFSDPVNTTAKDRTADMIKELRQASPTGRLLDLFAEPVLGTAAAEQIDVLDQKAPISLPRTTNEHDMVDIILQAVDNCRPLLKVSSGQTIMLHHQNMFCVSTCHTAFAICNTHMHLAVCFRVQSASTRCESHGVSV